MNVWKPVALLALGGLAVCATKSAYAGDVCQGQPNMTNALSTLRAAKASLEKAEHDKGGWREAALTATKTAIGETEKGCAFAR